MSTAQPIAVIGAGISGLTAARQLAGAAPVTVFEKARGVGGRTSTRRAAPWAFDHGAQYVTVRDADFAARVAAWEAAGLLVRWPERIVDLEAGRTAPRASEHARYVPVPGMNALCKHLAEGLDVRAGTRIQRVERENDAWRLVDTGGTEHGPFETVLVSAPPRQAADLLAPAPALQQAAASIRMAPCWAVMLAFDEPLGLAFDAAKVRRSPLAWIARNSTKPDRPPGGGEAWLLHASAAWSDAHVDDEGADVIAALLAAFAEATRARVPTPVHSAAHRWLYAQTGEPLGAPCLWDGERRLGVCGDWLLGDRVEAAWLSGRALAHAVGTSRSA